MIGKSGAYSSLSRKISCTDESIRAFFFFKSSELKSIFFPFLTCKFRQYHQKRKDKRTYDVDEDARQFLRLEIRLKTSESTPRSRICETDLEAKFFLHLVGHLVRISEVLLVYRVHSVSIS